MTEPRFLSVVEVERLHEIALERFGGSPGLRNKAGFESAVMHPQNIYFYGDGDMFEIAAAYCFHLAEAQAFLDGNKRTAAAAAIVFLDCNGYPLTGDAMCIHKALIDVAEKRVGKPELARLFKKLTA